VANKPKLENIIGRPLAADLFEFQPWGRRLVVVREVAPDKIGLIHLPDQVKQPPAVGWVASVGPEVGAWDRGTLPVGGCPLNAKTLLGCKVVFGNYAGEVIKTGDPKETLFESEYVLLNDGAIWGTIGDPPAEPPL
jgi:co-chaperonin GroES (HSP10)